MKYLLFFLFYVFNVCRTEVMKFKFTFKSIRINEQSRLTKSKLDGTKRVNVGGVKIAKGEFVVWSRNVVLFTYKIKKKYDSFLSLYHASIEL